MIVSASIPSRHGKIRRASTVAAVCASSTRGEGVHERTVVSADQTVIWSSTDTTTPAPSQSPDRQARRSTAEASAGWPASARRARRARRRSGPIGRCAASSTLHPARTRRRCHRDVQRLQAEVGDRDQRPAHRPGQFGVHAGTEPRGARSLEAADRHHDRSVRRMLVGTTSQAVQPDPAGLARRRRSRGERRRCLARRSVIVGWRRRGLHGPWPVADPHRWAQAGRC